MIRLLLLAVLVGEAVAVGVVGCATAEAESGHKKMHAHHVLSAPHQRAPHSSFEM